MKLVSCERLSCRLREAVCVERHRRANGKSLQKMALHYQIHRDQLRPCQDCPVGKERASVGS